MKGTSEFDLKIGFCFLEDWSLLFENQIWKSEFENQSLFSKIRV